MNRLGTTLMIWMACCGAALQANETDTTQTQTPETRATQPPVDSAARAAVLQSVAQDNKLIADLGQQIWGFAEVAFQEHRSSKLLADTLEARGFRVKRGVAEMPTAFVAEYGEGRPVIAILAEYDALPGLGQEAVPYHAPLPHEPPGHGCGHNIFGAASTGAALAVKQAIDTAKLPGTVRLYGCPAEEGGAGKVYMVRAGLFDDVDMAIHWHPGTTNHAGPQTTLAVIRFRVQFTGKAAHAAGSPERGRSALDAVELMNSGVNFLREHIISGARIHYVITSGGRRPNVVPEFAESWYYIRAPQMAQAEEIFERVKKIAEGATLMTETEYKITKLTSSYEILPNETLARLMDANLRRLGAAAFSEEEQAFAAALRKDLGLGNAPEGLKPIAQEIDPFVLRSTLGSTDVGDVSWKVPTAGLALATAVRGVIGHSWSMVACSGSSMASRGACRAAELMALTAVDVLENPQALTEAKLEFDRRTAGSTYRPVLGEGPPPEKLDDF